VEVQVLSRALIISATLDAMAMRKKITLLITGILLLSGVTVFFLGPVLFASVSYPLPEKYRASVAKWTQEYCQGLPVTPNFLAALIMTESGWRENAKSYAGAVGLTQFIPSTAVATAKRLGVSPFTPSDLTKNPDLSIRFGAYYICTRIRDYKGDMKKGLIAYNGGGGAVLAYERGTPVRGTVGYAEKILAMWRAYDKIYGKWWENPAGETGSFNVQPKTDISLIATVPILDFWRGLLSNPVSDQEPAEDASGVNDLWRVFLPGN
jgi:hypothetical protein